MFQTTNQLLSNISQHCMVITQLMLMTYPNILASPSASSSASSASSVARCSGAWWFGTAVYRGPGKNKMG
jgi:hypothetical protein